MKLTNKQALVTGASRGIGKAIALQLAREGAAIILHYHEHPEIALKVADEIKQAGARVELLQADFRDLKQVMQLGEDAWNVFDGVDFLINNAGISYKKHFLSHTVEDVNGFIDINLKATLFLTQTITRKMVEQAVEGSVYTITSINGIQPGVGHSVYGATKGALETLMKGVALELAPHNIKVNTLAVGAIRTQLNEAVWQDDETLARVNNNIPMHRMGEAEEVAAVLSGLLASGTYMTGSTVTIDGGWLLKHGFENPQPFKK